MAVPDTVSSFQDLLVLLLVGILAAVLFTIADKLILSRI